MAESEIVMDRGCFERGCACYDDRVDKDGVVVKLSKSDNLANLGIDSKDQKVMPTDYVVDMAREAGFYGLPIDERLVRFAALARKDERSKTLTEVMEIGSAEYDRYNKMVEEDDSGHEECVAIVHLLRKLEKLK